MRTRNKRRIVLFSARGLKEREDELGEGELPSSRDPATPHSQITFPIRFNVCYVPFIFSMSPSDVDQTLEDDIGATWAVLDHNVGNGYFVNIPQ